LLSLLDSQNFGEAPKTFGDVVVPTVEIGELYLLSKQVGVAFVMAAPVNGPNSGGGLQVPAGEIWRVHYGGLQIINGVGVTGDFTPAANVTGGSIPIGATISVAASTTRIAPFIEQPFWLTAGSELSVFISALVGAPTVSLAYVVSKLKA
jgi:hypothetical protein